MNKPSWRLQSCDEMRVSVGACHAYIDRVCSTPHTESHRLATLTFVGTGVVSSVMDLSPRDLRVLAIMLKEFANTLEGNT